jgi:hypothetical protein
VFGPALRAALLIAACSDSGASSSFGPADAANLRDSPAEGTSIQSLRRWKFGQSPPDDSEECDVASPSTAEPPEKTEAALNGQRGFVLQVGPGGKAGLAK